MAIDLSVARRLDALATTHPSVLTTTRWDAPWWKLLPKRWGNVMHAMCSYMGMFPASLPRYFIEQFSAPGDIVVDPFAGRGTTPLEACLAGRVGIGFDLNPLASLLTRAKTDPPSLSDALERVREMERTYVRSGVSDRAPPEIAMLYDGRRTMPQLLHMRETLDLHERTDAMLLASLTGILHGNHARDPRKSRCLSISMPNTFSMAPGYIRRFARAKKLRKYPFDAFERLRSRLEHLYTDGITDVRGRGVQSDALDISRHLAPGSVKLVVTSPPYLNVVRYGKFNWIRLWLLGESVDRVDGSLKGHLDLSLQVEKTDRQLGLSDRLNYRRYCEFLRLSLVECARVLRDDGLCVVTIGDVETNQHDRRLGLEVWNDIAADVPLTHVTTIDDWIDTSIKVSRIWGETKGRATKVDRVLVLRKKSMPSPNFADPRALVERLRALDAAPPDIDVEDTAA